MASAASVENRFSLAADSRRNVTIFGLENVLIQTVVNPFNIHFDVINVAQATCIATGHVSYCLSLFNAVK